jgi:exonuclease III
MIFLTLNCRGMDNPSKKLVVKRLVDNIKPSIIMLQETMTDGEKITQELSKLLRNWDFYFIDAIGRSGGNVTDGINAPSLSQILGPFL